MDKDDITTEVNWLVHWITTHQATFIDYSLRAVISILIICVGNFFAKLFSTFVMRIMEARGIDKTVSSFLCTLLHYIILCFAIVAALGHIGVETSSIVAVIGAASLAVGLSLKSTLANFASGVVLIAFRPLKTGEYVVIGGSNGEGTVQSVQIFSTTLLTSDGQQIVIPNNKLTSNTIKNFSREPNRRIEFIIGVGYQSDIESVKKVFNEIIDAEPRVIRAQGITVRLKELGASSINFVVRVWTTNSDYWPTYFDLLEKFKDNLDANNISIPYNKIDVNLTSYQEIKDK